MQRRVERMKYKQLDAHHETAVEQEMENVCMGSLIHFAGKVAA